MKTLLLALLLASASTFAPAAEIHTTELTIHPAPLPQRPLQYQLQPTPLEQLPGDALSEYMFADEGYEHIMGRDGARDAFNHIKALCRDGISSDSTAAEIEDLLKQFHYMLSHYIAAAKRERCDWNPHRRELGINALMPAFGRYGNISNLLLARAEVAAHRHQISQAIDDLKTINAMADQATQCPLINGVQMALYMVHRSMSGVEQIIQQPDAPNLYWTLTALPTPRISLRDAMRYEYSDIYVGMPELRRAAQGELDDEQWEQIWPKVLHHVAQYRNEYIRSSKLLNSGPIEELEKQIETAYPLARQTLIEQLHYPLQQVDKMSRQAAIIRASFEQYVILRQQAAKCFALPYWQSQPLAEQINTQVAQLRKSGRIVPPFSQIMLSLNNEQYLQANLDRRIAMLRIIEAIRLYAVDHARAPAKLDQLTLPVPIDPVTGESFVYEPSNNGLNFTLTGPSHNPHQSSEGIRYIVTLKTK